MKLTILDVLGEDSDKCVSVWSTLFMPAAQGVEDLMKHNSLKLTTLPN